MKQIYFDNAATTPVDKEVLKAMEPYFLVEFGNASSIHNFGQRAEAAILKSKDIIADFLKCQAQEIIFTSGATESNNTVLKSVFVDFKGHLITTLFEHPAILETAKYLSQNGVDVTFIKPEKNGLIDSQKVLKAIKKETRLISIMYVNNEIGTIQPIGKIGKELVEINKKRENPVLFHTDAVQAMYFLPMQIDRLRVDFMSISGHKIYGPKGMGLLYIKDGLKLKPLLHGGHQENGARAGTYNVPGIVGLGKAVELLSKAEHQKELIRIEKLGNYLIEKVMELEGVSLNGDPQNKLPYNSNFLFKNVEGESLLLKLDLAGIACSTGSACASGSLSASHVLLAIGIPHEEAHGSLRISLGKMNDKSDIDYFLEILSKSLTELRSFSPFK
ncbi:cysteine desulfurase [bacterium]|nr:cysteine desulfurase [bacterium]